VAGSARAQTADEPALKAAFLHNFVRFTTWPSSSTATGPLALCVLGNESVAAGLEAVERAAAPGTAAGVVRRVRPGDDPRACALLYAGALSGPDAAALIARVADAPVLTVGDSTGFTDSGGIIGFFLENNRMRFAVNVAAARRAHLQISSRLLSLAQIVGDPDGRP
jgi:YfiR/HmsC-like